MTKNSNDSSTPPITANSYPKIPEIYHTDHMSNFIRDFLYDPSPILPKNFTSFSDLNAIWNEAKWPANWTKSQTTKICQPHTQKWENEKELSFEIYAHKEFWAAL